MTNEELMYEIEHYLAGSLESGKKSWRGLAAVVRLHKPMADGYCSACVGLTSAAYPCATIKAVEAELA